MSYVIGLLFFNLLVFIDSEFGNYLIVISIKFNEN